MYEVKGMSPTGANNMNVPVDIWLTKEEGCWRLRAGNYMPRRGRVEESAYEVIADNREELVELVRKHFLPLYETAVAQIRAICDDEKENLYYWEMDDCDQEEAAAEAPA